jgi:hypothetical protein
MNAKRVGIGLKPGIQKRADEWVSETREPAKHEVEEGAPVAMKRLTIDVPADLHRRFKLKATDAGVQMADLMRTWIADWCARDQRRRGRSPRRIVVLSWRRIRASSYASLPYPLAGIGSETILWCPAWNASKLVSSGSTSSSSRKPAKNSTSTSWLLNPSFLYCL